MLNLGVGQNLSQAAHCGLKRGGYFPRHVVYGRHFHGIASLGRMLNYCGLLIPFFST
jgi:hypothetical protein